MECPICIEPISDPPPACPSCQKIACRSCYSRLCSTIKHVVQLKCLFCSRTLPTTQHKQMITSQRYQEYCQSMWQLLEKIRTDIERTVILLNSNDDDLSHISYYQTQEQFQAIKHHYQDYQRLSSTQIRNYTNQVTKNIYLELMDFYAGTHAIYNPVNYLKQQMSDFGSPTTECHQADCSGMLDGNQCNKCLRKYCLECFQVLPDNQVATHQCSSDYHQSLQLIERIAKSCPQCTINIEKTAFCNQMYCINCGCRFDWTSLRIIPDDEDFHNPLVNQPLIGDLRTQFDQQVQNCQHPFKPLLVKGASLWEPLTDTVDHQLVYQIIKQLYQLYLYQYQVKHRLITLDSCKLMIYTYCNFQAPPHTVESTQAFIVDQLITCKRNQIRQYTINYTVNQMFTISGDILTNKIAGCLGLRQIKQHLQTLISLALPQALRQQITEYLDTLTQTQTVKVPLPN